MLSASAPATEHPCPGWLPCSPLSTQAARRELDTIDVLLRLPAFGISLLPAQLAQMPDRSQVLRLIMEARVQPQQQLLLEGASGATAAEAQPAAAGDDSIAEVAVATAAAEVAAAAGPASGPLSPRFGGAGAFIGTGRRRAAALAAVTGALGAAVGVAGAAVGVAGAAVGAAVSVASDVGAVMGHLATSPRSGSSFTPPWPRSPRGSVSVAAVAAGQPPPASSSPQRAQPPYKRLSDVLEIARLLGMSSEREQLQVRLPRQPLRTCLIVACFC